LIHISRRNFLFGSAAATFTVYHGVAEASGGTLLVGTQTLTGTSKGIYAYLFRDGELSRQRLAAEADSPTFLALSPNRRDLLVANELDTYDGRPGGGVSTYSLSHGGGLAKVNEVASQGGGPCHVAFDRSGRSAFVANYGGGSAASFSVARDGRISSAVSFFQYTGSGPDSARQKGPHAHRVTVSPDNRFLLVNDLGLDMIHIYQLDADTAKLMPNDPAAWHSTPGSGPRALRFHPNGRVAYCVTEMASSVVVLRWDAKRGALETVQEVKMRAPDFQGVTAGSEIVVDREGRFAYAADRFDDIIATFAISASDGTLTLMDRRSCGGKVPRHLALDPSGRWLLVANQESDNIYVLGRDAQTGALSGGRSFPISRPQCLVFV
jgi:6-phosphogluconolactonase